MSTIIFREINGVNFQIFAEGWETRSSWGHRAKLFMNGYEISGAKIRYYNRTWEAYTYQSTIRAAIYKELQRVEARTVQGWKEENNRRRITKAQRAAALEASGEYQTFRRLYDSF